MTIQQKCAERIYELLPHTKHEEHFLPIRLADVLMAIGKDELELLFNDDVLVVSRIVSMYDLEKDNILDQSDEFCEFLLDLIK